METRMRTRVVATVAAVAALAVAVAAPASAHRGHGGHGVDRVTYPVELIYDNDVTEGRQDYVMFVGAPAEDLCGDDRSIEPITMKVKARGSTDRYWLNARVAAEVYTYTDGGIFDFLEEYCGGEFPEPYATGTGRLKVRGTSEYFTDGFDRGPDGWYQDSFDPTYGPDDFDRAERNWFRGSLRTAGGARVKVAAYADVPSIFGMPATVSIDVRKGRC